MKDRKGNTITNAFQEVLEQCEKYKPEKYVQIKLVNLTMDQ